MRNSKNIVMISYTSFIQKFYQTLPHEIAKQTGWNIIILVPPYWKELWSGGKKFLEKSTDELYDTVVGDIFFAGNLHFAVFRSHLKWVLQKYQPDIIDLENEPFNLGSLQTIYYRHRYSPHSKIVLHASQHQFKNYPPPFNFIERYVLSRTEAILARNDMAIDVLKRKRFNGMLKKVTHGVNTDAFRPRELKELCLQLNPEKKVLIGFVGALEEHKGIQHLLEAIAGLHCKLLLIGEGNFKNRLIEMAGRFQIDIQFVPSATHEEVAQLMNCMDIFILPSVTRPNWVEKFGRVLIEAMSSGVAIIGSSSGEISNVIGDAGLIFREGDVNDLKEKIRDLFSDKKRRHELGWRGRKRAQEKYSWKNIAEDTIAIYNKLLEDSKV